MTFIRPLVLALSVLFATASQAAEPTSLEAIPYLAGKDAKAIAAILGKPTSTEKSKRGPKMTYVSARSGVEWEILYIGGKADWITVTPSPARPVPYEPKVAIEALGLRYERPTTVSTQAMTWERVQGLRSVSCFPAGGQKIGYCYIKVLTD